MHHLIIDTCVWQDLAETEYSLIEKLALLIDQGKVTILLPEIIRDEWNAGKNTIVDRITKEIINLRRSANEYLSFHGVDKNTQSIRSFFDNDPKSLGEKLALERIHAIDEILDHSSTIQLSISEIAKRLAVEHALNKKAPFRNKNSMADALIFFTAVEWVDTKSPTSAFFVSHNISDYSDKKQGEVNKDYSKRLASDLQPYVEKNGLKYGVIVGQVLNDIEKSIATKEEVERSEARVEQIKIMDNTAESILSIALYAQKQAEEYEKMLAGHAHYAQKLAEKYEKILEGPTHYAQKQAELYGKMLAGPAQHVQKQVEQYEKMMKKIKENESDIEDD